MFPLMITLHTLAQLNAVLRALQPAEPTAAGPVQTGNDAPAWPTPEQADKANKDAAAAPAPKSAKASPAPGPRTATAAASPEADAPAPTAAASSPAAAPAAAQPPASTAAAEPAAPVTYAQVAAAITNGVKASREKTIDTLAKFGARKGPELKPEQYGPFLAALKQSLEEVAA